MKTMDMIVVEPFQSYKPHADMLALGYVFLCAHISIEAFIEDDLELKTNQHRVVAVESPEGYNFYVRGEK